MAWSYSSETGDLIVWCWEPSEPRLAVLWTQKNLEASHCGSPCLPPEPCVGFLPFLVSVIVFVGRAPSLGCDAHTGQALEMEVLTHVPGLHGAAMQRSPAPSLDNATHEE